MRYAIKEKYWSWGDTYYVYDENREPVFQVVGQPFSWGSNLSFQDTAGQELAQIRQTLLSWKPRFQILREGVQFAEVIKEFSWFSKSFTLDVPGPNDYTISGEFWQHRYQFARAGRAVAQITKKMWSWTDTYGIEIVDGEDDVAILCSAIVIDQVLHDDKNNS